MAYLYRHIRLDKNEVFYIGIGTTDDNHKRAYDTIQRSESKVYQQLRGKNKNVIDLRYA